jgi:alpha-L-fucosidase
VWEKFKTFVHQQVEELMTGYGRIDVLWLDGGQVRPPDQDIDMPRMAAMARRHQPGVIIADRTVGGCYENILTPEQSVPDAPLGHTWESCMTMAENWGFNPNDKYKSVRTLLHMLIDVVAKDGNLLLNVGPTPDGEFPPEAMDRLKAIGDWMLVNGEAIHGTRACKPYKEGNVCFTQKGEWVYAIVLAEEGETRPKAKVRIRGVAPAAGKPILMLGVSTPLVWEKVDEGIEILLPAGCLPCDHAWVVKILPD